jgi:hypothetical protein
LSTFSLPTNLMHCFWGELDNQAKKFYRLIHATRLAINCRIASMPQIATTKIKLSGPTRRGTAFGTLRRSCRFMRSTSLRARFTLRSTVPLDFGTELMTVLRRKSIRLHAAIS